MGPCYVCGHTIEEHHGHECEFVDDDGKRCDCVMYEEAEDDDATEH
jgi:hypothetical protein